MCVNTSLESKTERFEAAALEHMNSIYRFALCMTKNESDAQDLVQDTYLRAYRFFDKFEEGTNCRAWLLRILKNTFINSIRRERRQPQMIHLPEMKENEQFNDFINYMISSRFKSVSSSFFLFFLFVLSPFILSRIPLNSSVLYSILFSQLATASSPRVLSIKFLTISCFFFIGIRPEG